MATWGRSFTRVAEPSVSSQRKHHSGDLKKGADQRSRYEPRQGCTAVTPSGLSSSRPAVKPRLLLQKTMVAKTRKATGKSQATQSDRDKSPLVSPHGKSNVRRAAREGRAFNSALPNGLLGISHKLGLTPSGGAKMGIVTLLLGKLRALAC